ncbi:MAG: methylmalonyl Co-A mutase-associated GTPase MeaB [Pseudomonadota bacterium]
MTGPVPVVVSAEADRDGALALEAIQAGGKPALARALGIIEAQADAPRTAALLDAALAAQRAHVIGLTGPPGVGKSTLTDALIRRFRATGAHVGVIAVDPSSRRSGGALLGDRTRIAREPGDRAVFMRSMAARDRLGGLAALTFPSVVLMGALMDVVLVETVGVGQSETDVDGVVDTVVFCAQPGSGDALQYMKAGVMEIPDLVLVTKADLGQLARRTMTDMRGALSLAAPAGGGSEGAKAPELLSCSASTGEGLDAVLTALGAAEEATAQGRAARRRAQAWRWTKAAMALEFGRYGAERLALQAEGDDSHPFASQAGTAAAMRLALDQVFQNREA